MKKNILKPQNSEIFLFSFFILFVIFISLFFIYLSDKCRGLKNFDYQKIEKTKTYAILEIECGEIVIEIFENLSPKNSERFVSFVNNNEYVNSYFYKVKKNKFVEAGDLIYGKKNNLNYLKIGTGGSNKINLKSELSNDYNFIKGSVGMVRRGKFDTENSQFFILIDDMPSFNFQYTPIGIVISDLNILKEIKYQNNDGYVLRPDLILNTRIMNQTF